MPAKFVQRNVPSQDVGELDLISAWSARTSVTKELACQPAKVLPSKEILSSRKLKLTDYFHRIYQIDKNSCGDCQEQCKGTCTGPNNDDCIECANVKDGKFCVAECPYSKYAKDGHCLSCDESCNGCTGPNNTIASDGCVDCDHVIINGTDQKCMKKNSTCPGKINGKKALFVLV